MPIYEYACTDCGIFSALRRMSESSHPTECEECGQLSERIISVPHLAILAKGQRMAHERNEKSAHDPRSGRRSSCGCAGSHTCKTTADAATKNKVAKSAITTAAVNAGGGTDPGTLLKKQTSRTARPWMLGH